MVARFLAAFLVFACAPGFAQKAEPAVGTFLVASRDLGDPNFAKTVILVVHYKQDQGAVGIVVNRATDVPISRVFQDLKEAKSRMDPVYVGGPVELNTVMALLKTGTKPENSTRVFNDVYLISNKDLLKATLASGAEASVFHAYVGYAGWGTGQLEHEMELGAWHVMPADAATVFHSDPDSVWPRLIRRTETQVARRIIYTPPLP
jgi:putative transcriptional regulator